MTERYGADGARGPALRVEDLDEPLEDAGRTGRGTYAFTDELEAAVYALCDGDLSAAELAAAVLADVDAEASDPVSRD